MNSRLSILLTGTSGLLGNAFIQRFHHKFEIHAVTHTNASYRSQFVKYIPIDFSKDWDTSVLPKNVDIIIHLAQSPKYRDFPKSSLEVFNVNLQSTIKLLDYAIGANVKKFILASTGGIYGASSFPLSINSEIRSPTGLGHYFGSKLSSEIFANNYRDFFAVDINRIFFMYGPGQSKTMLIPRLIDLITSNQIVNLAGPDGISINPVYVNDVADFLDIQMEDYESHIYNVAGSDVISIRELSIKIQEYFGGSLNFEILPPTQNLVADASDFLEKMNSKSISINDGLKLLNIKG